MKAIDVENSPGYRQGYADGYKDAVSKFVEMHQELIQALTRPIYVKYGDLPEDLKAKADSLVGGKEE